MSNKSEIVTDYDFQDILMVLAEDDSVLTLDYRNGFGYTTAARENIIDYLVDYHTVSINTNSINFNAANPYFYTSHTTGVEYVTLTDKGIEEIKRYRGYIELEDDPVSTQPTKYLTYDLFRVLHKMYLDGLPATFEPGKYTGSDDIYKLADLGFLKIIVVYELDRDGNEVNPIKKLEFTSKTRMMFYYWGDKPNLDDFAKIILN